MGPLDSPKTLPGRDFWRQSSKYALVLLLVSLGWTMGAAAQVGPICGFGLAPSTQIAFLPVIATGGCTDATSTITSETLSWGDGSSVTIPTPFSAFSVSHDYTTAGTFQVNLTASDATGATTTVSQAEVISPNLPPTCNLTVTPPSGNVPLQVTASGSCSDPENDITRQVINWGDGTTSAWNSATQTHTYSSGSRGKPFLVVLTATDVAGNSGSSAAQAVTVNSPPTCTLQVTLSPPNGTVPLVVAALANCSDPDNNIVSIVLNWGDGSAPITITSGVLQSHTYTAPGTYMPTVTATDAGGLKGTASQTVTAKTPQNQPPTCAASVAPSGGQVPFSAVIVPNCSDPENDITSILVDFGDGFYTSVSPGASATHTFTRAGLFTTTVTASDSAGNVSNPSSHAVSASDTPTMFVGGANGQVKQFAESGNAVKSISTNQAGSITGMAFDSLDVLYVTDFDANAVSKFDGTGNLVGNFGSGYNCKPESIVFDNSGNAYVGETGCSHALLKFDAYGNLAAAYNVATEVEGSDWIDLASDQCTIYYTSQGTTVFRFNACTGQQQPPLATGLTTGLAVKILADSSVLVADKGDVVHFDSAGHVLTKYTAPGESCFVSLALDPDGKSFWALDYCSSDVVHFDIGSGTQLAKFNSGSPAQTAFGIGMRGPAPQITPAGALVASPQSVTVAAGQTASFSLAFLPGAGAANKTFTFSCANLPVGASCSFSPQASTVTAAGVTVHVTITTTAAATARRSHLGRQGFVAWWPFLAAFLLIADRRLAARRFRHLHLTLLAVILVLLMALLACSASSKNSQNSGSGNNSAPTATSTTPANNYAVVLHANSGSLESSTNLNLTVQ